MLLKDMYPTKVFTGVEATTYFPEDGCKIHVLVYGLDYKQFEVINQTRKDIYQLRDYLKQEKLTHSVAHASYAVNGKLNQSHLEKLILLFDHFEAINGGRNQSSNLGWHYILTHLSSDIIQDLYKIYKIEPISPDPWVKGFTGGSDDHGELFIGATYTKAEARSPEDFLTQVRQKKSTAEGRHNNYHALAFTVCKIGWDFSKYSSKNKKNNMITKLAEQILSQKSFDMKDRLKLKTMKSMAEMKGDLIKGSLVDLIEALHNKHQVSIDHKLDIVYDKISNMADAYFMIFLDSLESDLKEMNLIKLIRNISSGLPGLFLLIPFFSSMKHMNQNRELLPDLKISLGIKEKKRKKKVLWFTDTLSDLNGVSITLKRMGLVAYEEGRELMIVSSLDDDEITNETPPNLLNLKHMYRFPLPFYENYRIKIPSVLESLKQIQDFNPDMIIISTPGPIGLLALLAAKIMQVECVGIYHTDFSSEAEHIIQDDSSRNIILSYEKWFYNQMDEIRVPTNEYKKILDHREINVKSMGLLRRGIEADMFYPFDVRKMYLPQQLQIKKSTTLLYAGRVSKDKSLELLAHVYLNLIEEYRELNLIIAGNGPFLSDMKEILAGCPNVLFTGAMPRDQLPKLYNAADFFVFPSVTDTFGMVILEAQACGLPAIVSNFGGPKEVIIPSETGFVVNDQSKASWIKVIEHCIDIYQNHNNLYNTMRIASREHTSKNNDWKDVIADLVGNKMV